jgi:hypothetical protein
MILDPRLRGDDRGDGVVPKKTEAVRRNGLCLNWIPAFAGMTVGCGDDRLRWVTQLHPVVAPQLLHFRQEPFLTIV